MSSSSDEYEYQFWDFTAKELFTGFREVILETIEILIKSMYSSFQKTIPEERWPTLSSSCQTLLNEYLENASEHLNTLESYILENFSIPPHILLKEDSVQRQQYSDQEKEDLDREIEDLKRRISRVQFLEYYLLQEWEKGKYLKTVSEKVEDLTLPEVDELPSCREVHQILSESVGLEVEEANCHLKDDNSEESTDFNEPNHRLKLFKKRRKTITTRNV